MTSNKDFSALEAELDTIFERQLKELLIHRHIFRQFADVTRPYVGSQHGAVLADWITGNYVAFAATTVRRMCDRTRQTHSLIRFLGDVKKNCQQFSRLRMRQQFVDSLPKFAGQRFVDGLPNRAEDKADEMFDYGTGTPGLQQLSRTIVEQDISVVNTATEAVTDVTNGWIAHDSKTTVVSSLNHGSLNSAIDILESVFSRYYALVTGNKPPFVPLDDFDCKDELQRVWPPKL